ncbi:MAG: hypothetical protein RL226_585 [Bacteroidota bacterium]
MKKPRAIALGTFPISEVLSELRPSEIEKAPVWGFFLAEREGFEPPVPRGTTVFKTAAIDHSAISPRQK